MRFMVIVKADKNSEARIVQFLLILRFIENFKIFYLIVLLNFFIL